MNDSNPRAAKVQPSISAPSKGESGGRDETAQKAPSPLPELPALQFETDLGLPVLGPLLAGTLRVDCTGISLKGTENGSPKEFTGPGYIVQTDTEGFAITIFVAGTPSLQEVLRPGGAPSTLISDAFTLEATDEFGRHWRAENIWMPATPLAAGGKGYVVRALGYELTMSRTNDGINDHSIEVWSRGEQRLLDHTSFGLLSILEQPRNLAGCLYLTTVSANTFQSSGLDFAAFHHHGNTCVRAMGRQPLPTNIGPRVWESMLFALAGPLDWSAIRLIDEGTEELRIRSPRERPSSNGNPPILQHLQPPTGDTWCIFDCYLRYVLRGPQPPEPKLHPLSSQVFSVRNSAGASIEAQSHALTVAVENVLNTFLLETGQPSDLDIAALKDLMAHLKDWPTKNQSPRKRAMQRAMGAIGGFKNASATDRLRALVSEGVISQNGVEAWKKLRNAGTHGDWSQLGQNHRHWADLTSAVSTLLHQLIFHLIGYKGAYTDYGTHGYPLRKYPPNPATGPSPSPDGAA